MSFEEKAKEDSDQLTTKSSMKLRLIRGVFLLLAGLIKCFGWICYLVGFACYFSAMGYGVYVWWNLIVDLSFLEFAVSIALFFVTIPLAPIYIGVEGDWGPLFNIVVGLVIAYILVLTGEKTSDFVNS